MRSGNWNPNFAVAMEYKTDLSTTANITVATLASANMTDADPISSAQQKRVDWHTIQTRRFLSVYVHKYVDPKDPA